MRPARFFLSWASAASERRGPEVGKAGARPEPVDRGRDRVLGLSRQQAPLAGDPGRGQEAPAHGFAVREAPVARDRLERVAQGVPEVQDLPLAAFALVTTHHLGLDPAGGRRSRDRGGAGSQPSRRGGAPAMTSKSARSPSIPAFNTS